MTSHGVPAVSDDQRRARLATRHLLAPGLAAPSAEAVTDALVALHSTDAASVYLSAMARLQTPSTTEVERALYDDRTLVRMHGMRQTLFVFPTELASVVQASTTRELWLKERGLLLKNAVAAGLDEAWLEKVEAATTAEVRRRGSATGAELGKAVPGLRDQVLYGKGTKWEAWQPASGRVLRVLGFDGAVVRGRPVGTWLSSQHRWEPGTGHADIAVPEAQAELARRWLHAFGPATEADLKWWTGWKVTDARKALKAIDATQVALTDGPGWLLPDDLTPVPTPEPWAALLPALDPTTMGWQGRDWYLAEEIKAQLFDRAGNAGPTLWWNGEVVGGWIQLPDRTIATKLLRDIGREGQKAIAAETERWQAILGEMRVTPRFRTPVERELSGG
ncbi:winged helix DNA-binding domain-containing protein [Catenulispora rubra]|uniref:winged helix DNA-binding domain-containing protein n=1 Tax=Catenulispora rubra TaxID=280293 RepID=UPI002B272042|nr:winged helix DNA-binding domain-containing protein [Catenulispora rubra]